MARLLSSGFELNSITANVEIDAVSASTITIVTSPVRSGTYALRSKPTSGSAAVARFNFLASDVQDIHFARAYIYVAAAGTAQRTLISFRNSANSDKVAVSLNTDLTLQTRNIEDSANIGSASSALSLDTWYRLELKVDTTTLASTSVEVLLDGVSFATGTIDLATALARFAVGSNTTDTTYDVYFDDVAVNNDAGSFQNSWPGSGKIIHLRPNAAGDSNGFLTQVGGTPGLANNFTRVNEVTPDDATSYNGSAVLNAEDLFTVDASGIGASDTVNLVAVGVRMADLVAADATAAFKVEIEKTSGGTKSQSAALIPNATTWKTNAIASPWNYPLITYQDPDSSAWTQATLDTMQIGYIQTATNVQVIAISTLWALVEYDLAAVTTTSTSSSTSTSTSTSSTSSSTSLSTSTSTSISTSTSVSTTSTSTSLSTSTSISTSSTSSSTSTSFSTSTSISTSTSLSTSTSTSLSTSSSTSVSTSTSTSTSTSSTSVSTSSTSTSTTTVRTDQRIVPHMTIGIRHK